MPQPRRFGLLSGHIGTGSLLEALQHSQQLLVGRVVVLVGNHVVAQGGSQGPIVARILTLADAVLQLVSQSGANILTINHAREDRNSEVGACIVSMVLETRNSDHVAAIQDALTTAGYPLIHNA